MYHIETSETTELMFRLLCIAHPRLGGRGRLVMGYLSRGYARQSTETSSAQASRLCVPKQEPGNEKKKRALMRAPSVCYKLRFLALPLGMTDEGA